MDQEAKVVVPAPKPTPVVQSVAEQRATMRLRIKELEVRLNAKSRPSNFDALKAEHSKLVGEYQALRRQL